MRLIAENLSGERGGEPVFEGIGFSVTDGESLVVTGPNGSGKSTLALARGHFLYERRLRGRIEKLDESLRTMRSVERAKSLLMRLKNVSEEEAYNYLRRQAMERRVTIGAVASAIIDSYELLG